MKKNKNLNFLTKGCTSLFVMVLVVLVSSHALYAQGVNMDKYITLTVMAHQKISLALRATEANTPIKIVSGTQTYEVNVNTDWTDANDYISRSTTMTIYGDLNGFDCSYNNNKLTGINVEQNPTLTALHCMYNQLNSLDVSANTALEVLYCYHNEINNLDISNNTSLTTLRCEINNLASLNVANGINDKMIQMRATHNPSLLCIQHDEGFEPSSNPCQNTSPLHGWCKDAIAKWNTECVNEVDTNKYIKLTVMPNRNIELDLKTVEDSIPIQIVGGSKIYNVIVSNRFWTFGSYSSSDTIMTIYGNIKEFKCAYNEANIQGIDASSAASMTYLDCQNNQIKYLNVSTDTALRQLFCSENQLTNLNVSNNTALTDLDCSINKITNLDLSHNLALITLDCGGNRLTNLDVSTNTDLKHLSCRSNQITNLDVSANTTLNYLNCGNNKLTDLDVSANTDLQELFCYSNLFTNLDLHNNIVLNYLDCGDNRFSNLDVSANTALQHLHCDDNQLTDLDVSANTTLQDLHCDGNQLSDLDLSHNPALNDLKCQENQLTSLDVRANTALEFLYCFDNQLTELCVNYNTLLRQLKCSNNPLKNLDVSDNTALLVLYCHHNQLTNLDIHNNTLLVNLICANNYLKQLDLSRNTDLMRLNCSNNYIKKLDISNNKALTELLCHHNNLYILNVANTNNAQMMGMYAFNNFNLDCIQHDEGFDPSTDCRWKKDDTAEWNTNCAEGVEENVLLESNVQLYPNPTHKEITVKINGTDLQHISVYNAQGTKVLESTSSRLNLQSLGIGIYFVEITTTNGEIVYKKLVKE